MFYMQSENQWVITTHVPIKKKKEKKSKNSLFVRKEIKRSDFYQHLTLDNPQYNINRP